MQNSYNNNNQLSYYLAGLIESDGSIIIPKLNSSNSPTINIIFNIKDKDLAIKIKDTLGYGSIQLIPESNAVNLVIRDKKGIINLINLINGKLRTPKILKLHKLIDWINTKTSYFSLLSNNIVKLPLDNSNLMNNVWLSGFSEGDSNFYIRFTKPNENRIGKGKNYYYVSTTFDLIQTRKNTDLLNLYKTIMETIANLFLAQLQTTNLSTFDRSEKQLGWRVRNTSIVGAAKIVEYFNQFPLFSSKHLDFFRLKRSLVFNSN